MAKKTTGEARVLADLHNIGAKPGDVLVTDADTIKSLREQGAVDPAPEAVAYARSQGANEITFDADAPDAVAVA